MTLQGVRKSGMLLLSLITTLCINLIALILAVLIFLLIPFVILVIIVPFGVFRYCIKNLAKWLRPDLSKMVNLYGSMLSPDIFSPEPFVNIVSLFIGIGTLDVDRLKETVTRNMLERKFPNGEIKYPELKQYLTPWMGYFFWKDDKAFDLDRQVTIYRENGLSTCSDSDIQDIYEKFIQKPWDKKKPLWEISVVHNYFPKGEDTPHTVLFFREHHTLGDGYSVLRVISEGFTEKQAVPENAEPTFSKRNCLKSACFWVTLPFMACFDFANYAIAYIPHLSLNLSKMKPPRFMIGLTDKIPIQRVKDIKAHFRVSFASVVHAVCAGALRDLMILKDIKVPGVTPAGTVLPVRDHTEKLRNELGVGILRMATGEPDPVKRLRFSSKDYGHLKNSAGTVAATYLSFFGGVLPRCFLASVHQTKNDGLTVGLTSFPAGFEHMWIQECKIVGAMFAAGAGVLALNICVMSYVDGLRISVVATDAMVTREELNQFVNLLQKHVDILHDKTVKDVTAFDNKGFVMV